MSDDRESVMINHQSGDSDEVIVVSAAPPVASITPVISSLTLHCTHQQPLSMESLMRS